MVVITSPTYPLHSGVGQAVAKAPHNLKVYIAFSLQRVAVGMVLQTSCWVTRIDPVP